MKKKLFSMMAIAAIFGLLSVASNVENVFPSDETWQGVELNQEFPRWPVAVNAEVARWPVADWQTFPSGSDTFPADWQSLACETFPSNSATFPAS